MSYTAFKLDAHSREQLLKRFPPKFPEVIAHHVTVTLGVNPVNRILTGFMQEIEVVGYAVDDGIEAIVVSVDGSITRKDGNIFHITLSLDRSLGRKPVDSNKVIATKGWQQVPPFKLSTTFELIK